MEPSLLELREALKHACRADEVISPVDPRGLARGRWWSGAWPERLTAGVLEPRRGFRFRPENLVLARMLVGVRGAERVVELGSGSGSLLLIAACLLEPTPVALVGVERQAEVAERLERTLAAHALSTARVVTGDLREASTHAATRAGLGGAGADLVLFNPPYFPPGWGRESASATTHASTHALHGDVGAFFAASRALLAPGGRILVVFDAQRLSVLLATASEHGLRMTRTLFIPDQRPERDEPTRVWVELSAELGGGATLEVLET